MKDPFIDTTQQYPGSISGSETSDPEINFRTANEDARLNAGGVFQPTTSSKETTDSLETAGRKTPTLDSLETAGRKTPTTDSLETAGRKTPKMDSLETGGRKTPMTPTEQQTKDNVGAQIPDETTTRSFPNGRCDEQDEAKCTDRPRSGKSVAKSGTI
ncbi:hypothetical protein NDU88_001568 [Pleurodeles waltl]|uniref:Uncharacterized protein n=1 Tax=Pleurodeles waltl TaxID=8319 RepID=A0AAV7U6T3_PLEWA|nr:hypothetical protein NDU88_001568 [Pleurodeles waltl]